ncbi:uncharacterized protein LOC100374581 [Saccoglossus kowalevskii]|uniref:Uncharacterized protein LOC100374581 isoform X2 n=1 Tax=Saccoglossus kowalevskii TaxID=10224 RepID=A0ABM0GTC5_SACKO|nr:PREDICTED: uncharacterized protein LOC100374581 isoform X2 [Saccoglossus kowalevskii]XP_006819172.1 PREDICTED: uncharacterized protein LOC100374581 isoform X4 [Saccoglossus kowalevskii]
MNQITVCAAFIAILCVQTLAADSQGDSGYTFADEDKIEDVEEDKTFINGLMDFINCKLYSRLRKVEDSCDELSYNMVSNKRATPGRGTLGLMFGRRSSDFAKRNNGRRQSFS